MATMGELREKFNLPICDAVAAAREYNDSLAAGKPVAATIPSRASTAVPDKKTAAPREHEESWRETIKTRFHRDV